MPFSQSTQLSSIVGFLEEFKPASILDVGVGMGQYGFLARTNLENVQLFNVNGDQASQREKCDWQIRIDGIEAFKTYHTVVHDYAYNKIYWDDALTVLPSLKDNSYELVIAIDILEHFTTEEGVEFLNHLKRIAKKCVMVSTPKEFIPQEIEANPHENHRSLWTEEELKVQGYTKIIPNNISWIAICAV